MFIISKTSLFWGSLLQLQAFQIILCSFWVFGEIHFVKPLRHNPSQHPNINEDFATEMMPLYSFLFLVIQHGWSYAILQFSLFDLICIMGLNNQKHFSAVSPWATFSSDTPCINDNDNDNSWCLLLISFDYHLYRGILFSLHFFLLNL